MTTHSSILAWSSPWTEKPGGLQSDTAEGLNTQTGTDCFQQVKFCISKFKIVSIFKFPPDISIILGQKKIMLLKYITELAVFKF